MKPRRKARAHRAPLEVPKKPGPSSQLIIAGVLLSLVVSISYANVLRNGFVWDDNQQIVMNPYLRPGSPVSNLFSSDVWGFRQGSSRGNYYRPLQMLSYRIAAAVSGFDPAGFHLLSLAFAIVTSVLALCFFWKITRRFDLTFAAAALFAAHPIHTEAVDWISALPDVACTLFVLLAFIFFLDANEAASEESPAHPKHRRALFVVLSLVCYALALLWKETAAVFPLLILAYCFLGPSSHLQTTSPMRALRSSLPYWVILVGYLFTRLRILGHLASRQHNWSLSGLQYGLTAADLMMKYWTTLIFPFPLNAYHVFSPVVSLFSVRALLPIAFILLAGLCIGYAWRRARLLGFAALWVFITLLPVLDIYAVGRNVLAERYLYLPSVGFCLFVVLLADRVSQRLQLRVPKFAVISLVTLIVAGFVLETFARNPDWKDNLTLFSETLEHSPNAAFVHNMVAASEAESPSTDSLAESHYQKALSLATAEVPPDNLQIVLACEGLAWIRADRSDLQGALDLLERVRNIDSSDPEVDGEEGLILSRVGRWSEAERYLQRAAEKSQDNENVLNAMGIVSWHYRHQLNEAARYFSRALAIHSADDDFSASVHNNLGAVYGEQGNFADAIKEFQMALAAAPNDPEYHTNLAKAFLATGRYDEARSEIATALRIQPTFDPARELIEEVSHR